MKIAVFSFATFLKLLLLLTSSSFAQDDDKGSRTFYNYYIEGVPVKFYIYEGYKIKPTLKVFDKEKLTTPEGLLWSLQSCKSQEWFNELRESPRTFSDKDIETGDPDSNYIELADKIVISKGGSEYYSIVKFYYKSNHNGWPSDYRLPGCLCMKKQNGYWKIIPANGFLEPYYDLMFFLKKKYIEDIFIRGKSELKVLDDMIQRSWKDGVLQVSKFYIEYQSLFNKENFKNDPTLIEITDKGLGDFINSDSKSIKEYTINTSTSTRLIVYQKEYLEPYVRPIPLYKGIEGSFSNANQILLSLINKSESGNLIGAFFSGVVPKDTTVTLTMTYKMEMEYLDKVYTLIKYKANKKNQTSYNTIVVDVKDNNFVLTKLPKELDVWYDAVNRLKPGIISEISSSHLKPDENYPEYFPVKEKSIDETGRLNITLLVKTLNEIQKTNPELYKLVTN